MRLALAEDSAILRVTLAELLTGRGHDVVVQAASDLRTVLTVMKIASSRSAAKPPPRSKWRASVSCITWDFRRALRTAWSG